MVRSSAGRGGPVQVAPSPCSAGVFEAQYELGKRIGKGGFGEVWQCVERQSRREVACKVVQKLGMGSEARLALDAEIAILRRLQGRHPGVTCLEAALESPRALQVVMELCKGGDLFDLVSANGPLPEASARLLFVQLASALDFCHAQGILHRDIKPENILLDRPAACLYPAQAASSCHSPPVQAKLADFGLSVALQPGETTTGAVGSPYYTAPELLQGRPYGRRVDIWSLGVVLCVMLTRKVPFSGRGTRDELGLRQAILAARVNFSQPCWQGVSQDAKDLVARMLQPDPQKRIRAHELLLHPWCSAISTPSMPCRPVVRSASSVDATEGTSQSSDGAALPAFWPSTSARLCLSAETPRSLPAQARTLATEGTETRETVEDSSADCCIIEEPRWDAPVRLAESTRMNAGKSFRAGRLFSLLRRGLAQAPRERPLCCQ